MTSRQSNTHGDEERPGSVLFTLYLLFMVITLTTAIVTRHRPLLNANIGLSLVPLVSAPMQDSGWDLGYLLVGCITCFAAAVTMRAAILSQQKPDTWSPRKGRLWDLDSQYRLVLFGQTDPRTAPVYGVSDLRSMIYQSPGIPTELRVSPAIAFDLWRTGVLTETHLNDATPATYPSDQAELVLPRFFGGQTDLIICRKVRKEPGEIVSMLQGIQITSPIPANTRPRLHAN